MLILGGHLGLDPLRNDGRGASSAAALNASTASRPTKTLGIASIDLRSLSGLRRRAAGPAGPAPRLRRGPELVTERVAAGLMVEMRRGAARVVERDRT
jgi:hypothetical protein